MPTCILCAKRGRTTSLDDGHVCARCAIRLADDLDAIPALAAQASVEPRAGRGSGRTVPGSRPPIDLAGVDPALTAVAVPAGTTTVLEVVESWCRLVREERQMAQYGPWSAAVARTGRAGYAGTTTTLVAATGFLRAHVDWAIRQPWVDDMADEMRACARALRHLDADREPTGTVVPCPTVSVEAGDCGCRLRISERDVVRCPRCGREWDTDQLVRSATADTLPPDVWVDAEAAAVAAGVHPRQLIKWARRGLLDRSQGRYRLTQVMGLIGDNSATPA